MYIMKIALELYASINGTYSEVHLPISPFQSCITQKPKNELLFPKNEFQAPVFGKIALIFFFIFPFKIVKTPINTRFLRISPKWRSTFKKFPKTPFWKFSMSSNTSSFPPRGKLDFPRSLREQRKK